MTQSFNCTLYYSIPGKQFDHQEMHNTELVIAVPVLLNIYSVKEEEDETDVSFPKTSTGRKTELSIAHEIDAPQFFCSETWATLVDNKGHILTIGNEQLFAISLYRNIDRAANLKIKFDQKNFPENPEWLPTAR